MVSLLHGPGPELGLELVSHPLIRAAGFTGSPRGGRALLAAAAARPEPIPFYGELGSINPVIVLPEALRARGEEIAEGLRASATLGTGQYCTNPGLVLVLESSAAQSFVRRVGELFRASPPATMLNPKIWRAYREGLSRLRAVPGLTEAGVRDGSSPTLQEASPPTGPPAEVLGGPGSGLHQGAPAALVVDGATFLARPELREEVFGPSTLIVRAADEAELEEILEAMGGHLTGTLHGTEADLAGRSRLLALLRRKVGRLIVNGFPTGVEVCAAMNHGGPYPAATDVHFTSVGTAAIYRFARPICFQNVPEALLPPEVQAGNPLGILRLVNNEYTREAAART